MDEKAAFMERMCLVVLIYDVIVCFMDENVRIVDENVCFMDENVRFMDENVYLFYG
jgi:hypothetical protein